METLTKPRRGTLRPTIAQSVAVSSNLKNTAIFAMGLIQQKSLLLGLDTMSLDEINDEIKQARQEKGIITPTEFSNEYIG